MKEEEPKKEREPGARDVLKIVGIVALLLTLNILARMYDMPFLITIGGALVFGVVVYIMAGSIREGR